MAIHLVKTVERIANRVKPNRRSTLQAMWRMAIDAAVARIQTSIHAFRQPLARRRVRIGPDSLSHAGSYRTAIAPDDSPDPPGSLR